jgi:hypothetical protein
MRHGNYFFDMIRYARSKHTSVRTTTDASLLHLPGNYKKCGQLQKTSMPGSMKS